MVYLQEQLQQWIEQIIEQMKKILERLKRVNPLQNKLFAGSNLWRLDKNFKNIKKTLLFYPSKKRFFLEYDKGATAEHVIKKLT